MTTSTLIIGGIGWTLFICLPYNNFRPFKSRVRAFLFVVGTLVLLQLLLTVSASADIYKYRAASGKLAISNTSPPEGVR